MSKILDIFKPLYAPYFRKIGLLKSHIEIQSEGLARFISYEHEIHQPPLTSFNSEKLRIVFIIPDFHVGAGGHMTIFNIVHYLETFGHEVHLLIQNPSEHMTAKEAKEAINTHFQPFRGEVYLFEENLPDIEGDALIATDRFTCYPAKAMGKFIRKFYLVQDYEPYFYPVGSEYLLTEETYNFDFDCLCAGEWLSQIVANDYGRWSVAWPLAYDRSIYNVTETQNTQRHTNRIAFYARYVTPRRAVELCFLALKILHSRGVAFEVDFFGWDIGKLRVDFPYINHGILDAQALADLYRQSTIGLVFSATNHSLVNKEMMACGLPVVDLDRDNVRAIFPDDTIAFTQASPEAIADCLEQLLANQSERDALQKAGLAFVDQFDWEKSSRVIESALKERIGYFVAESY